MEKNKTKLPKPKPISPIGKSKTSSGNKTVYPLGHE